MIVQASSRLAEEAFGAILVGMGVLSEAERDVALEVAAAKGQMLGDVLIEHRLLSPIEVAEGLREQVRVRVANCLRLEGSRLEFHEGRGPPSPFRVALAVPSFLLGSVAESVSTERMVSHLGVGPGSRLRRALPSSDLASDLEMGPKQARMIRGLAGRAFGELLEENESEAQDFLSLVYTLWALRRIEVTEPEAASEEPQAASEEPQAAFEEPQAAFEEPEPALSTRSEGARTGSRSAGASSSASREQVGRVRQLDDLRRRKLAGRLGRTGSSRRVAAAADSSEAVIEAWLKADRQDYFRLLRVKRDAAPSDVAVAYGALLRRFRLESPPDHWPSRAKEAAAGLLSRANMAYAILTDAKERKVYREHLEKGGGAFVPQNPMVLVGAALRAASRLRSRGRYAEAVAELKTAIEAHPKEPALHLALGRTCFEWTVSAGAKMADEAAGSLATAARLDPALDDPWLFLGLLARFKGDEGHARKLLRKALSVNPRNERASAELSSLEGDTGLLGKLFGK